LSPPESSERDRRDKELKGLILSVLVHEKPNTVRELVDGVLIRVEADVSAPDVVRLVQADEGRG